MNFFHISSTGIEKYKEKYNIKTEGLGGVYVYFQKRIIFEELECSSVVECMLSPEFDAWTHSHLLYIDIQLCYVWFW